MFFKRSFKEKTVLVLDIRSSSVAIALVKMNNDPDSVQEVIYTKRVHFFFENAPAYDILSKKIKTSLDSALSQAITDIAKISALSKKTIRPEEITIIYGSPWYDSKFVNLQIDEKVPFLFTQKYLDKVIKLSKLDADIPTQNEIMEQHIASITLNGYETENPFNKKVSKVDLSFYLSSINRGTKEMIDQVARKHFHSIKTNHVSHAHAFYTVLKNKYHSSSTYLIFEVTGEMTELIFIKDFKFEKIITVPVGNHFFARALSKEKRYDLSSAWTKLSMFAKDKLDKKYLEENKDVYLKMQKGYLENFGKLLEKEKVTSIPSNIFIISDSKVKDLIREIIESPEGYAQTFKSPIKPIVFIVNSQTIKDLCLYKKDINSDPLVSIAASFAKIEYTKSLKNK